MTKVIRYGSNSLLIPFLWLFLITVQIKMDNTEAFYPFFRIALFALLPFAFLYFFRVSLFRMRFTKSQWVMLALLSYLILYPLITMLFVMDDSNRVRNLKDAAYTASIYLVLFYLLKKYFVSSKNALDFDVLSRFLICIAIIESIIALALRFGMELDFGQGLAFRQRIWLDGRLHGVLGTPSHLAPLVGIACLFFLIRPPKFTNTLQFCFLFVVLVMTGSRGALLGFLGAAVVYYLSRLRLQFSLWGIVQLAIFLIIIIVLIFYFWEKSQAILQIAFRSDAPDWEKSRMVMWKLRLLEFYQSGVVFQLFGLGHRSVDQTFNANIEYLLSYGLVYLMVFNVFYFFIILRFISFSFRYKSSTYAFLLMLSIFSYLFSQGINFMFYQFVHVFQLSMVIILIGYFGSFKKKPENFLKESSLPKSNRLVSFGRSV